MTAQKTWSYTSEPVDYLITPITFDAASGITTMIGATVRADAINTKTGEKVAGFSAVINATQVRSTFAAGSLFAGEWELQTLATPPSASAQVIHSRIWPVKEAAF